MAQYEVISKSGVVKRKKVQGKKKAALKCVMKMLLNLCKPKTDNLPGAY